MGLHEQDFTEAGLQVIAVGIGRPTHAERYCGKLTPKTTCLTDETTDSHESYGLRQGTLKSLASLGVIKASLRAMSGGNRQGQATGDQKMLPGTFIVDRAGHIRYTYYSEHAGDHPDIQTLIETARALTAEPVDD